MVANRSLERWFSNDQLEICPDCGQKELVPPAPAALIRLCLACGVVPKPAASKKGAAAPQ
jgi:hypothetical protein